LLSATIDFLSQACCIPLVVTIIAFVCEFVAIKVKQTKQQQNVTAENKICAIRNGDCIIEDHENDSRGLEATTEYQAAIEATEIDQPSRLMQEDEDSESEKVTAGRNIKTIVAEVNSQDESNLQAASQVDVAENMNSVVWT